MPLARFSLYSQGVDVWLAPTLAAGDSWISTMQHIACENRMFVIGVNPVLHVDAVPTEFPNRDQLAGPYLAKNREWLDVGTTVIVSPRGGIVAGPVREREETLYADLDLGMVASASSTPPATTTGPTYFNSSSTPGPATQSRKRGWPGQATDYAGSLLEAGGRRFEPATAHVDWRAPPAAARAVRSAPLRARARFARASALALLLANEMPHAGTAAYRSTPAAAAQVGGRAGDAVRSSRWSTCGSDGRGSASPA